MRRRELLAAGGLAAIAGCVDQLEELAVGAGAGDQQGDEHPLAGDRHRVALRQETAAGQDPETVVPRSLTFWEEHVEGYAGFPVGFEYEPAARDADIEVIAVDSLAACGDVEHSQEIAGCAPLLRAGHRVPEPIEVVIDMDRPLDQVIRTAKHELGHVLGLGHDDEPAEIMANDPRAYIPEYDQRRAALEDYETATRTYDAAIESYNTGIDAFDDEQYRAAAEELAGAEQELTQATSYAELAEETTVEIGDEEATAVCSRAITYLDEFTTAVSELREAATALEEDDHTTAEAALDRHREAADWLDEHTFPNPEELYEALGLDGPSFTD